MKLFEEKIGLNLYNFGFGNVFLDMTPKQTNQTSLKLKTFMHQSKLSKKWKIQATDSEKIFANHILIRYWYLEYIKNSYNSTTKRQTTQFLNGKEI